MNYQVFFRNTILFEGGIGILAIVLSMLCGFSCWGTRIENFNEILTVVVLILVWTLPLIVSYHIIQLIQFKSLTKVKEIVREFFDNYLAPLSFSQLVLVAFLAGFGEELFFRGFLQLGGVEIYRYFGYNPDTMIIQLIIIGFVSLLFAMLHAITGTYFFLTFAASIYFGFILFWTDTIFVPIGVHALYDFWVFLHLKMSRS
ncbi:MAG: lysostaphin resistance A-like protein [Thermoguttaceae bacterium]